MQITSRSNWTPMARRHTKQTVGWEFDKRRSHLKRYQSDYRRVCTILFDQIIDRCVDVDACVIAVRYSARARILKVTMGWARGDYPRVTGTFALWRYGIYAPHEIEMWPKAKPHVERKDIPDMTDDEIIAHILTAIGAPWSNRFAVPQGTGALHHDASQLVRVVEGLGVLVPFQHQSEYADLLNRVREFSKAVGPNLVDENEKAM